MRSIRATRASLISLLCAAFLAACGAPAAVPPTQTYVPTASPLPTLTATPPPTATLPPTPMPTATAVLVRHDAGEVICPIFLYHRVQVPETENPYYVTPQEFREQMQALKQLGYQTITMTQLVDTIENGGLLPERPAIISFDDGDATVYSEAFPVMRELGFIGINFLVVRYLNTPGYMTDAQVRELVEAGWEVGSHGMTHADLTKTDQARWEMLQSKNELEERMGTTVSFFAFPYGAANDRLFTSVRKIYHAAVGLGPEPRQSERNLSYLWRRPVDLGWDVATFATYLPWK